MMTTRGNRFAVLGLFLLVLGSGVAIGVVVERVWLSSGVAARKLTDQERTERLLARFKKNLGLGAAQETKAREVMSRGRTAVSEILARVDPEVRAARQQSRDELTKLLTPEQAAKYQEMVKRYRARKAAEEASKK